MGSEIERKFLVKNDQWRKQATGCAFLQGYLSSKPECNVRVRIEGDRAKLTIKGKTKGVTRTEFQYDIPVEEARQMLEELCERPLIEKTRYRLKQGELTWEIDEFYGDNQGLVVAEVELQTEDQAFDKPEWLGSEVSDDPRYYNAALIKHPFRAWK